LKRVDEAQIEGREFVVSGWDTPTLLDRSAAHDLIGSIDERAAS
jgi:hypothetical protein